MSTSRMKKQTRWYIDPSHSLCVYVTASLCRKTEWLQCPCVSTQTYTHAGKVEPRASSLRTKYIYLGVCAVPALTLWNIYRRGARARKASGLSAAVAAAVAAAAAALSIRIALFIHQLFAAKCTRTLLMYACVRKYAHLTWPALIEDFKVDITHLRCSKCKHKIWVKIWASEWWNRS